MNAKRVKQIRRNMRVLGISAKPSERAYERNKHTGVIRNEVNSPRNLYQRAKRDPYLRVALSYLVAKEREKACNNCNPAVPVL